MDMRLRGAASLDIQRLAQELNRRGVADNAALSFSGVDTVFVRAASTSPSGRQVQAASPKEIERLAGTLLRGASHAKAPGVARSAQAQAAVQALLAADGAGTVITARHVRLLATAMRHAQADLGRLGETLAWVADTRSSPGGAAASGDPSGEVPREGDFLTGARPDRKAAHTQATDRKTAYHFARNDSDSDSDSPVDGKSGPVARRAPRAALRDLGPFTRESLETEATRRHWREQLAAGAGVTVLAGMAKAFEAVKPPPASTAARLSYPEQDTRAWLQLARFVADACAPAQGGAPALVSAQAVQQHLPLSVRASLLTALAQAMEQAGPAAAGRAQDGERFARLAAAFSDAELMPVPLAARAQRFQSELLAALEDMDWQAADPAARLQALGLATQALSVEQPLGLDMFTPVRAAGQDIAPSLARHDGKARAIALDTRAGGPWDDRKAVVAALVYELSLLYTAGLAEQLSRGEAPRDDSLHQLARVMRASEQAQATAGLQALPQRHALAFVRAAVPEAL